MIVRRVIQKPYKMKIYIRQSEAIYHLNNLESQNNYHFYLHRIELNRLCRVKEQLMVMIKLLFKISLSIDHLRIKIQN
jgi:hypothetical protein